MLKQRFGIEPVESDSEEEREELEPVTDDEPEDKECSDTEEYDEYFKTGKAFATLMQTTLEAKCEAQTAAAAKIMEEVKKVAEQKPDYEEANRRWSENRNMTFKQRKQRDEIERMQNQLNEASESILSPFVVSTKDDDLELCPISVEHKDGWKAISILIDSGASDPVAPPGTFPDVKTL